MPRQNTLFGFTTGIADAQAHEKAVELAFRQRISALEFKRILRGQDEERRPERSGFTVERNLMFAHRFEKGRLRSRRGAVNLVGQDDLGEQRPRLEDKGAGGLIVNADAKKIARQQVGRKLNAMKRASQTASERLGQERLTNAWRVLNEQMALGEE